MQIAGTKSSGHLIRELLPAYLDHGLCLSGTYLEAIIGRSGLSGNIPYAWVCSVLTITTEQATSLGEISVNSLHLKLAGHMILPKVLNSRLLALLRLAF